VLSILIWVYVVKKYFADFEIIVETVYQTPTGEQVKQSKFKPFKEKVKRATGKEISEVEYLRTGKL